MLQCRIAHFACLQGKPMKGVDTCACREDILGQCGHACLLEVRTPPHTPVYWRTGQTLLVGGLVLARATSWGA